MTDLASTLSAIEDDFALFSDWEERYAHLIELGRAMNPLPDADKTEANRVRGCASQVWLTARFDPESGLLHFAGDSDAHLVRGLVALMIQVYSGRTPQEALDIDAKGLMERLGLNEALTPQRSNGLAALVKRMRQHAQAAL